METPVLRGKTPVLSVCLSVCVPSAAVGEPPVVARTREVHTHPRVRLVLSCALIAWALAARDVVNSKVH